MKKMLALLMAIAAMNCLAQDKDKGNLWINNVRLSGFGIARYQYTSQKGQSADNSFDLRVARVSLDGRILDDFYWKTQMQITGSGLTYGSSPRLLDLYVEWQKYPYARVRVGQFILPFTYERMYPPIDNMFSANSKVIDCLVGGTDRSGIASSNGRDQGVELVGDVLKNRDGLPLLHYVVSVVNGQGINLKDVDSRKSIVGGAWISPVKGMRLGVFGWDGTAARTGCWTDETTGEECNGTRSLSQYRYAISGEYKVNDWTFCSEYIHSTGKGFAKSYDGETKDCSLSALGNKSDGGYASVIAPIIKDKVHVKARYSIYRESAEWSTSQSQLEIGADWMLSKYFYLTAAYIHANNRKLAEHNYDMADVQLRVRF